jgi:opacity protein-like surface antigen
MKNIFALVLISLLCISADAFSRSHKGIALGGDVGVEVPVGKFGDVASPGFGVNGVFNYFFTPDFAIRASLGYYGWGSKNSNSDLSFSDVPLQFGIEYDFNVPDFQPFIGLDFGLHFGSWSSTGYDYYGFQTDVSESATRFGISPLAGAAINVSKDVAIKITLKYNIVSKANFFGINGGVIYYLPGH